MRTQSTEQRSGTGSAAAGRQHGDGHGATGCQTTPSGHSVGVASSHADGACERAWPTHSPLPLPLGHPSGRLWLVPHCFPSHVQVTNLRLGAAKAKAGLRAPEDKFQNTSPTADDVATADRASRVVSNDIENIPLGLICIWASLISILATQVFDPLAGRLDDYHSDLLAAHMAFTIIFCVARYLHSIIYSLGLPTLIRSTFWLFGVLAMLGVAIVGVIAAFRKQFDD